MKPALNLFFKYPEMGKVKTRLSTRLESDFVYRLYWEFIRDTIKTCGMVNADLILTVAPSAGKTTRDHESEFGVKTYLQRGNDLGERMHNSMEDILKSGYNRCILLGSDIPDISADHINKAFDKLKNNDIVLGPCNDGGYYLIGLNREKHHRDIFKEVPWSSSDTLEKTLENIIKLKLRYELLDKKNDIDSLEDLKDFYNRNRENDDLYTMRFLKTVWKSSMGSFDYDFSKSS